EHAPARRRRQALAPCDREQRLVGDVKDVRARNELLCEFGERGRQRRDGVDEADRAHGSSLVGVSFSAHLASVRSSPTPDRRRSIMRRATLALAGALSLAGGIAATAGAAAPAANIV